MKSSAFDVQSNEIYWTWWLDVSRMMTKTFLNLYGFSRKGGSFFPPFFRFSRFYFRERYHFSNALILSFDPWKVLTLSGSQETTSEKRYPKQIVVTFPPRKYQKCLNCLVAFFSSSYRNVTFKKLNFSLRKKERRSLKSVDTHRKYLLFLMKSLRAPKYFLLSCVRRTTTITSRLFD